MVLLLYVHLTKQFVPVFGSGLRLGLVKILLCKVVGAVGVGRLITTLGIDSFTTDPDLQTYTLGIGKVV